MRLNITEGAAADISKAADWYDNQRAGLSNEFFGALETLFKSIQLSPESFPREECSVDDRYLRRGVVRRFPYKAIYEITGDGDILVLTVSHTSRHPDAWRARLL